MKPIKEPRFSWQDILFVCGSCGAVVEMELSDYRNKNNKFAQTLHGGWEIRALCCVCGNATARFTEKREDA